MFKGIRWRFNSKRAEIQNRECFFPLLIVSMASLFVLHSIAALKDIKHNQTFLMNLSLSQGTISFRGLS